METAAGTNGNGDASVTGVAGRKDLRRPGFGRVAVAMILVIIVALFAGLFPRWSARASLRLENVELAATYVNVIRASTASAESTLELPGEARPYIEAPIYARTSGYLKRWLVDLGAEVKQGQLLAEIDTPEVNQQLAQARAQLAQWEATRGLAETTAARWKELLKSSSVSQQEVNEKVAELATSTANVEAAKANAHRLEELQSFQKIVAPFDGTITARKVDAGQLITSGSDLELFRLAQTRTLRVYVRVPQTYSDIVTTGVEAQVVFKAQAGHIIPAKVVRTAGEIDGKSRTLLVELEVKNDKNEVFAGAYAEVRFKLAGTSGRYVVPANAFLFRSEGPQLGVVGQDGKVDLRSVTLGRDFGTSLEVLSGIGTNDQIIVNPSDSLAQGAIVKIVKMEEAPDAQ